MAPRLYFPARPVHMVSPQSEGVYDEKPELGYVTDGFWQGPVQQIPWGSRKGGRAFARGMRAYLPAEVVYRAPWSIHYFRDDPVEGMVMHSQYEALLDEWALLGGRIVWDFHDGLMQDTISPSRHARWPMMYPLVQSRADADAAIVALGPYMAESYDVFLNWLDRRPRLKAATDGFELMNEPMSYNEAVKDYGRPEFYFGLKLDHLEMMVGKIRPRHPTKYILAPMIGANVTIAQYLTTFPANRGGKNCLDAIRDIVGRDWLGWAMHRYPSFDRVSRDLEEHKAFFIKDFGALGDDPVCVTEMNIPGEWILPDQGKTNSKSWRGFFNGRYKSWLAADEYWPGKPAYGMTWWPFSNVSRNPIVMIYENGSIGDHYRHSRAAFFAHLARDGSDERFFGPLDQQKGIKATQIMPTSTFNSILPDEADEFLDGWNLVPEIPAWQTAVRADLGFSWGGAFGTVHHVPDDAVYSTILGGDGKAVILDHTNAAYRRNHYFLGRGGGVVRMGPGAHVMMAEGGQSRVYTCPNGICAINLPYGWDNQVIVDPASTKTWLWGLDRQRGDKISFKGAFGLTRDAGLPLLRAAMRVVKGDSFIPYDHLFIDLPGGGVLQLVNGGDLAGRLHEMVLEWTDGWYAPGWSEPVDYTAADFSIQGPPTPPTGGGESGRSAYAFDRDGRALRGPYDRDGGLLSGPFDRAGRGGLS